MSATLGEIWYGLLIAFGAALLAANLLVLAVLAGNLIGWWGR